MYTFLITSITHTAPTATDKHKCAIMLEWHITFGALGGTEMIGISSRFATLTDKQHVNVIIVHIYMSVKTFSQCSFVSVFYVNKDEKYP